MVTKKEQFKCSVCGKLISAQGRVGHERSKYHLNALAKQNGTKPVLSIASKIVPEMKGIKTTITENINDTNKTSRSKESEGPSEQDGWDGYLC